MAEQKPAISRRSPLPEDVVLEILARLSVKSLLRFRCICKSWNSYITDPYFITTHLKQSKDRLLYMAHIRTQTCIGFCNEDYCKILEFGISFPFCCVAIRLAGSSNGLICLVDSLVHEKQELVYLWNCSTRKLKTLPSTCLSSSNFNWFSYGFAYDSENDDYKIVRTTIDSRLGSGEAEVYSLNSDSWRRIDDLPLMRPDVQVRYRRSEFPSPLFGGSLHWILQKKETNDDQKISYMIMLFDVSTEKFRESELPPRLSDEIGVCTSNLGDYKGKLALFVCTYVYDERAVPWRSSFISIWVMRDYGVAESWTKSVVVQFKQYIDFYGCTEDGALAIGSPTFFWGDRLQRKTIFVRPEISSKKHVVVHPPPLDKSLCIGTPVCTTSWKESLVPLSGTNVISWHPEIEY